MKKAALLLLIAFDSNAFAKCDSSEKTIFSCLTTKAKLIEVCDAGKTISYSFGYPSAKAEIVVIVPRNKVTKEVIIGTGCINSSVDIPNGNTVYRIYAVETLRQASCPEAGVEVIVSKKNTATVKCKNPNSAINNIAFTDLLEALHD